MNTPNTFLVYFLLMAQVTIVNAQTRSAAGQDATPNVMIVSEGNNATEVLFARPMEMPIAKRKHYIDCRGHLLYFAPIPELRAETQIILAKAKEQAGGNEQLLMLTLATSTLQRTAFTVDVSFAMLNQLALLPREAPPDCDARGLSAEADDHCFIEYCKTLDPGKDAIHLIIRGIQATEVESMRKVADSLGIEITTSNVGPEDVVRYGLNE
ncbi:MAG TPA: hypothetical protein PKE26_15250 [Kiritimatiellia bacterium]|nr:hypothetical protein [Kiritimatiellia bacterium]HMP00452.1 hypothetical protein [Kiritimatiellia bacterium]